MVRSFIAIEVRTQTLEEYVNEVHGILSEHGVKFKLVDPKALHITLKFLGDISEAMISRLSRDLERIEFKRFLLKAKGIGFFPNHKRPRVIYIGVDEGKEKVSELAQIIEGITSKLGFPRETRRFKPHITIARIKKPFPPPPVNILTKFGEKINEYVEINQIKLKKSTLTPTGPIYEDLYVKDLKG